MSVSVRVRNGMAPSAGVGGVTEGDLRGIISDMIDIIGVVDLAGGHLLVHQATSPSMNVVVDTGVGYIPNTSFDATDTDSIKFWEGVVSGTTGSRTVSIASNSSGSTRIDLICLKLDPGTSPDNLGSNVASFIRVAGTPGAGVPATPTFHLKLAEVTVANGASSIVNANITDSRVQSTFKSVYLDLPSDLVTETDAQVLTNKRVTKRVQSTASSATPTPNADDYDMLKITALAADATFGAPTGTPTEGQPFVIRIKDDGTARALAYNSIYRAIGLTLPTTTVIGKLIYLGMIYNSTSTKWDVIAYQLEA